ncbi:BlaI/MecI/CopY family transcriptional regulator [Candidatus Latescibacterota bacterium]
MARKRTAGLTARESEILTALWDVEGADVQQIRQRLSGQPTANTVRTLLGIMVERGLVRHDGKAYGRTYRAGVSKDQVQRTALRRLMDTLFAGSAEEVILHLVGEGEVDAGKLAELQARLSRDETGE